MVIEDDQVASIEDDPVASIEVSRVSPILDPWWSSHHHPTIVIGCLSDRVYPLLSLSLLPGINHGSLLRNDDWSRGVASLSDSSILYHSCLTELTFIRIEIKTLKLSFLLKGK